ncbi:helix-turn-helix domain-containing protein [uncultured Litoreibacter sp.]|uniref:helix-turn-helix domain-containing protein n=1 Tax=uncultured Litoreibacter sp. TaxID=1392394 RepID=UPI0026398983|nr:helix-turn-helix domain-containing protein [uncultured Litoreibacter sp.]
MSKFGPQLQFWRKARRLSQLQLAVEADVSSRHISFLETGRAAPSRPMVQHLSDILDVPHARRNDLFDAAGFSPQHSRSALTDEHMQMVSSAMSQMLERHAPFPAIVIDANWVLVQLNKPAQKLFGAIGLGCGANMLDFVATSGAAAQVIENWPEVGHHFLQRLTGESRAAGGLRALDKAITSLRNDPAIANYDPPSPLPPLISINYSVGGLKLPMISAIAQFGGAEDLTVTDLKIELMFPATKEAQTWLEENFGSDP